jgi:hypothetical protein
MAKLQCRKTLEHQDAQNPKQENQTQRPWPDMDKTKPMKA